MVRRKTTVHSIFCLVLLGGSSVYAQNRYSQATLIDNSEFLSAVKEVSLDLQSDDSLAQYISLAAQRNEIVSALAGYGITVRPNAPVTLAVRVTDHRPVVDYRNVRTNVIEKKIAIHGIYISLRFFVKAAALRNGKLHLVWAAPETSFSGSTLAEDDPLRKVLLGDTTQQDNQKMFVSVLGDCLKALAPAVPPEPTSLQGIRAAAARQQGPPPVEAPWAVNSWTEKAKAAVDAEFVRIMSPGTPVDKTPFEGISGTPEIVLDPHFDHDDCKADSAWRNRWAGVFQRLHWTDPQQPPTISLKHFFSCVYAYGAPPRYFALSDNIYLREANLVFPLNGRLVRKWASLATAHHEQFALEDDVASRLGDFLPRNIQDFLTDLVLGNSSDVPPIPSGPNPPTARFPQAPRSAAPAPDALHGAGSASDPAAQLQWVRSDIPAYVEASQTGFARYKKGDAQLSQGYRMWDSLVKPAPAKGCWVVQGTASTTLSCLLLERADLNDVRSYYTELNKDVIASLPRDWKTKAAPPFGGDLPNQGYESSSGAHLEVWIARAASGGVYEIHFQLVSAH
ncbi:MAG TPA: hypothetical protein VH640_29610 [Bryobacteraceae bacterium]